MPVVHIPTHMRDATGGSATLEAPGETLRAVFDAVVEQQPDLKPLIFDDRGRIRGDLAIAINAEVTENNLLRHVEPDDEIRLVPAIGGGAR